AVLLWSRYFILTSHLDESFYCPLLGLVVSEFVNSITGSGECVVRKLWQLIQKKSPCCLVTLERMRNCELCERFQRGYLFSPTVFGNGYRRFELSDKSVLKSQ